MWLYFRLFLLALRLLRRDRRDLVLENLALRQHLAVFERRGHRPPLGHAGPMTASGVTGVVRRRAEQAGITDVHPHRFRHTFAHEWLA